MPPSAKKISENAVEIPFPPYTYAVSGGTERWILQKVDAPDNLEFSIIYNDRQIIKFPLGKVGAGTYEISGIFEMDKIEYKGVHITLNEDGDAGSILFEKIS